MVSALGAFCRSPLGGLYLSPLGARTCPATDTHRPLDHVLYDGGALYVAGPFGSEPGKRSATDGSVTWKWTSIAGSSYDWDRTTGLQKVGSTLLVLGHDDAERAWNLTVLAGGGGLLASFNASTGAISGNSANFSSGLASYEITKIAPGDFTLDWYDFTGIGGFGGDQGNQNNFFIFSATQSVTGFKYADGFVATHDDSTDFDVVGYTITATKALVRYGCIGDGTNFYAINGESGEFIDRYTYDLEPDGMPDSTWQWTTNIATETVSTGTYPDRVGSPATARGIDFIGTDVLVWGEVQSSGAAIFKIDGSTGAVLRTYDPSSDCMFAVGSGTKVFAIIRTAPSDQRGAPKLIALAEDGGSGYTIEWSKTLTGAYWTGLATDGTDVFATCRATTASDAATQSEPGLRKLDGSDGSLLWSSD